MSHWAAFLLRRGIKNAVTGADYRSLGHLRSPDPASGAEAPHLPSSLSVPRVFGNWVFRFCGDRKVVASSGAVFPGGRGEDDRRAASAPTDSHQRVIRWARSLVWLPCAHPQRDGVCCACTIAQAREVRRTKPRAGINSGAPQFAPGSRRCAHRKLGVETGVPEVWYPCRASSLREKPHLIEPEFCCSIVH